jgi:hypothetical protein
MTLHRLMILALLAAAACESKIPSPPTQQARISAADLFTQRYAQSRFAGWKIHAHASGHDCDVLFVETGVIMEDSMVEAMHYGAGAYGVVEGGVQRFSRDRSFRGVAYRDFSGRVWTYGAITTAEPGILKPCD